jgi:hypothetical protein
MVATKNGSEKMVSKVLLAADVAPLEFVADEGWYRVTLQLGANANWRGLSGGCWETEKVEEIDLGHDLPKQRKRHMRHIAALHEVRRLDGATVNGLIAEHNAWHAANIGCGPRPQLWDQDGNVNALLLRGTISRQFLVVSIEPDEAPQRVQDSERLAEIASVCKAVIQGLVESGVIGPNANAKGK